MISSDCIELIHSLEDRFPVDSWRIGALHVWPLVRKNCVRLLDDLAFENAGPPVMGGSALSRGPEVATGAARWARARWRDRSHEAAVRPASVVLLGDGYSRVEIDGSWHDRLLGPLATAARGSQRGVLHLERNHIYRTPRDAPARWIQPRIDAARVAAVIRRRRPPAELSGYDGLVAAIRQNGVDVAPLSVEHLHGFAAVVESVAHVFGKVLFRTGAQVGISVDPDLTGLAFNLACRRAGVPSVEVLHGCGGEGHWMYASWRRMPSDGYGLVPNVFWVWTDDDGDVIEHWARRSGGWHRAVVGGNPALEQWRSLDDPRVARYDQRVAALQEREPREREVLVALQRGMTSGQQDALWGAISGAPASWRWWVRLHPTMDERERSAVRARAARAGGTVDVDGATALPLYALLRRMHAVVTASSSTIIEAEEFGVRSVALDPNADAYFPAQFASGVAVPATDAEAVVAAVEQQCQLRSIGDPSASHPTIAATIAEVARSVPVND
jgi:hypothetical protein